MKETDTTFVLCEDRPAEEVGLRVVLCSLRRHCPGAPIVLYRANPRPEFVEWLRGFPSVRLIPHGPEGASGWNCKPHALLPLLRGESREVVWLDSDIVLTGDPRVHFRGWGETTVGVCEEYRYAPDQGSALRTRGWGLEVGREFPRTLNTAVLRFTPVHVGLLMRWQELLAEPRYLAWQSTPLHERPLHFWGDQDVLNALLGSAEFREVPVELLRTGREIIHALSATSYTMGERLSGFFRAIPTFVHGQGPKPWIVLDPAIRAANNGQFSTLIRWMQEVSPYRAVARSYRRELGIPCEWLTWWSVMGRFLQVIGFGHFALRGMPVTAAAESGKLLRRRPAKTA